MSQGMFIVAFSSVFLVLFSFVDSFCKSCTEDKLVFWKYGQNFVLPIIKEG